MTDDGRDPFEELARRAGSEVRRAAPDDGLQRLRRSRRRRQLATGTAVGVVVVALGAGAALVASRGDDRGSTVIELPTTVSTTSTTVPVTVPPPPTSAVSMTTAPVATTTTTTPTTPPTTTVASTTTTTEASTTTISPVGGTAPGVPTDQLALVLAGTGRGSMSVLGGWNGTSWAGDVRTSPITSVSAIGPGLGDEVVTGLALGPEGPESDVCLEPTREAIDFGREVTDDDQGSTVLAVTADWPLQPRPAVRAGLDAPVYQQVGESVVAGHDGVDPTKGDVTEVIRADLDGDGSEEVVFGFEYFSARASGVARGDFSVVIARFARPDGTVRDQPLVEYYAQGFDAYGDLAFLAIADLNGDGVMEVALRAVFWEGSAVTVYALQDGGLAAVLGSGCSN